MLGNVVTSCSVLAHPPRCRSTRPALYIGQASGSAIGGFLYARDLIFASGYVAAALVALAVILTKPRRG